jgi:hypothetical protein
VTPRQILALLEDHPLPWRSEPAQQGDGWQVTDGRGLVVALCSSAEVAGLLVLAVERHKSSGPVSWVTS